MARGGYRPGAGRPKGAKSPKLIAPSVDPMDFNLGKLARFTDSPVQKVANPMPLEYLLAVMNDCTADEYRRDRMAIAAAPYVHARAGDVKPGNEENGRRASKTLPAISVCASAVRLALKGR